MNLSTPFTFGDRVILDGDKSLVARVIAFNFKSDGAQVEIAWLNAGAHHTQWVDNWRLSPAESA